MQNAELKSPEIAFLVIIHLCRELKELKVAIRESFRMTLILEWIICAYEKVRCLALQGKGPGVSRLKGMTLDPIGLGIPLENLRRVELRHQDPVSFNYMSLFIALPSLREF